MAEVTTLALAVDSRQVRTAAGDLDRLSAAGRRSEQSADGLRSAFNSLRGVFAVIGAAQLARATVNAADAYTSLNARLRLVTATTADFVAAQRELFNISQQTGTGLEQTSDLFGSLSRSTEALGVSQGKVLEVTRTINQALAVSGTSAQAAQAALTQLGQGFAAGALRGEELNSVLEQAPRLARAIADGLGVSIGQLRQLGQEGQLTGERVFRALERSGASIQAEFNRLPLTVERASTQAGNALLKLIGTLDAATGATSGLAGTVQSAAGFFSDLADEIERVRQGQESASLLANAFVTAVEALQVFGANVSFVFQGVGREIGAIAAQIAALARLDISGFRAISEAVKEDGRRARAELDAFERRVLSRSALPEIGQNDRRELARRGRNAQPFGINVEDPLTPKGKKKSGRNNTPDILGFDLAEIRRQLDGLTSAYRGAETILEASRAANLIDARTYYQARQQLIRINETAEVQALQAENARLAQEKGNEREKLANQQKILDNEAKITQIRGEAATQLAILGIQESASIQKLADGYAEAEAAAQSYLDTLRLQQQRELASRGRGDVQRERAAGRAQIEDRFQSQRDTLSSERRQGTITDEQYTTELDRIRRFQAEALRSYEDYFNERLRLEGSFAIGAAEALANYRDEARNVAEQTEQLFTNAFKGAEDALVTFITTGKLSFSELADSIVADIARIIVKQQLVKLFELGARAAGGSGGFFGQVLRAVLGSGKANGGSVAAGGLYPVNERGSPELLTVGNRQYLMMGREGGQVTPTGGGQQKTTNITLNVTAAPGMSRASAAQQGAAYGRAIQAAMSYNS